MKKALSVIVVNYKSRAFLEKCISSVFKNVKEIAFEVILINNDAESISFSSDFSQKMDVKVINSGKNIGFGKACNAGSKKAKGEVLLFLNPDAEIATKNIKLLLDQFSNNPKLGIIGPKLLAAENRAQEWSAGKEVTLPMLIKNNLGFTAGKKIWESTEKVSCAWVSGAAMFIRKSLFERLQGFDEDFFMYFEDIDLCLRARQVGSDVVYYPNFKVKHLSGKSFIDKSVQKKYYYTSQDHYFQKHFSWFVVFLVRTLRSIFI